MKTPLLFLLLLLVAGLDLAAQPPKRYSFTHYGVTRGLASNEVITVVQDASGFIWIGGTNGLQRFDGTRYKTFRHEKNNPASLPGNHIAQLILDKKNNLWVQSRGDKVGIFDTKNFTYKDVPIRASNPIWSKNDKNLRVDEAGNVLLIIGNHELLTYDEKKNEFAREHNFVKFPIEWGVVDVYNIPGTKKYIIGSQKVMSIFNLETKNLSYPGHNIEKEAIIDRLGMKTGTLNYMLDQKGRLWFDTWEDGMPSIYVYDLKKKEPVLEKQRLTMLVNVYHESRGFLEQKDGTIWVNGLGVFGRYLEKEKTFQAVFNGYENEQSIAFARVNETFEDKEGNIWVATSNNGIYRFNPAEQFFTNIRHINRMSGSPGEGSIMAAIATRQGTVLAGAWGDGIYHYDKDFNFIPLNLKGYSEKGTPSAWCMVRSRDSNKIWVGAQPGIHLIDEKARTVKLYNPPILMNRTVRQVAEDRFGNLWIGMQSTGVFKWNAEKGNKNFDDGIEPYKSIPQTQVLKITVDRSGYVWIATSGTGLYMIDPATDQVLQHFGTSEPEERKLNVDGVGAIFQYDDTTMVIGSNALHIYHIKLKKITSVINLPESVPGSIAAIEKDKNGYLWLSMTSGIFRINLRNRIFIHFDRLDGIVNDRFILAASCALPDGRLIFGADNQLVVFNPLEVRINDARPDVAITGFELMNRPLKVDSLLKRDRVELAPEDNSIAIEFAGLRYGATYIIRYMLEGMDKDWKLADQTNTAVYSYLPPGSYTFMIRSEDAEGKPGNNITKMVIRVRPPFWKTWWFLGLVIFAATAVLFYLDKLRIQKLRAMETVRTRIATSLTEDMSSSLTNINISSELAKTKIDSDRQRTKEYIGQISETSNRMVQAMYDMVWSIDPKNDTMPDTIERMKTFANEIENSYSIAIDFDIDKQVEKLALDMELRYEILCIYKEAVMNAAKHSDGRHVKVSLRFNKPKLMLMILDDGRGFSMDDAAMLGRGISDMRRRAAAINAILYVESEINTGTVVKLEIPV